MKLKSNLQKYKVCDGLDGRSEVCTEFTKYVQKVVLVHIKRAYNDA